MKRHCILLPKRQMVPCVTPFPFLIEWLLSREMKSNMLMLLKILMSSIMIIFLK